MIDIITYILVAGLSIVSIFLVYVIYKFAWPAKKTIIKELLRAKEKNLPLVFLWNDGYYEVHCAESEEENFVKTKHYYIRTPPGTVNYTKGGIRVVFADGYKGVAIKLTTMLMIEEFVKLKITKEDVANILLAEEHGILPEDIKKHREKLRDEEYFKLLLKSIDSKAYEELYKEEEIENKEEDEDVPKEKQEYAG